MDLQTQAKNLEDLKNRILQFKALLLHEGPYSKDSVQISIKQDRENLKSVQSFLLFNQLVNTEEVKKHRDSIIDRLTEANETTVEIFTALAIKNIDRIVADINSDLKKIYTEIAREL